MARSVTMQEFLDLSHRSEAFGFVAKEAVRILKTNDRTDGPALAAFLGTLNLIFKDRRDDAPGLYDDIETPAVCGIPKIDTRTEKTILTGMEEILGRFFDGLQGHVTDEANRVIAAKAPKRRRTFGHEGNGLKGPKTKMMVLQKKIFFQFLKQHPEDENHSRISRAHQLWHQHPEWEKCAKAVGEAKGYSSHKALAAAR